MLVLLPFWLLGSKVRKEQERKEREERGRELERRKIKDEQRAKDETKQRKKEKVKEKLDALSNDITVLKKSMEAKKTCWCRFLGDNTKKYSRYTNVYL